MDYFFETNQLLLFEIYDIDTANTKDLARQDFLGRSLTSLADVLASKEGALTVKLRDEPDQSGELTIRAEEVDKGQKEVLHLVCHGFQLSSPSAPGGIRFCCFGVDPFLEFHRIYANGSLQMVHRSEVQNSADPEFYPMQISVRHLCEGDKDREFLVQCFDYKLHGKHELLGSLRCTVNQLIEQKVWNLPLYGKEKRQTGGLLQFLRAECRREFTWLDFLRGGMQLEFAVSVDFAHSKAKRQCRRSSQSQSEELAMCNEFELAIGAVLEVCKPYNSTNCFEAFASGARVKGREDINGLFPLDVENWQPAVEGIRGVLEAHRKALTRVEPAGQTKFEPTIRHILKKCRNMPRDGSKYQILLIITEGMIVDMESAKLAIIEASDQPLSIIIIGIGDGDFTKMEELDSDDSMLKHKDRMAIRDIVQFVPFRNYYKAGSGQNCSENKSPQEQLKIQAELAKAVLEEIPYQVTSYCKMHNIEPRPAGAEKNG